MVLKMFCMYDRKSLIYNPPLFCHNSGHALRVFTDIFRQADSVVGRYPDDFQVWEIGTFDDQTGATVALLKPHLLCAGTELMPVKPKEANHGDA